MKYNEDYQMNDLVEKEEDGIMEILNVTHNNQMFLVYNGPHMLAIANADKRIISMTMINDESLDFEYLIPDYASGVKKSFSVHPNKTTYNRDNREELTEFVGCILNKHAELVELHA